MKTVTSTGVFRVLVFIYGVLLSVHVSAQCRAAFSYNINRASKLVTFTSNTTSPSYSHNWSFGDSSLTGSILTNPVRTFPRYGTYYVGHTIYNGSCSDSVGFYVTIDSIEPSCKVSFGYFVNHNTGVVSINNTSSGAATGFYFWEMGYGPDTNGFNPVRQYPPGVYEVCLTKANGSCIDSICSMIPVGCEAAFTWKQDTTNGLLHFSNFSATGPDMSYKWTFGDLIGGSSVLFDPSYHFKYNGEYYVCLTVTRGAGSCSKMVCDTVVVDYPAKLCQPYISYTKDTVNNHKFHFYGFVGPEPANSYHWTFGDNSTSSLQEENHLFPDTGSYKVCLTSRRFDGCISTLCQTVLVYPDSTGNCQAVLSYIRRSDTTDQDGVRRSVYFNSQLSDAHSQVWLFGDPAGTSRAVNPSYHFAADGTYKVCLVVFDSALSCADTTCTEVKIGKDSECLAAFSYQLYADSAGGSQRIAVFRDESPGAGFIYNWIFGDSAASAEQHPFHYYENNGLYKICLVIRDPAKDCFDSTCKLIEIGPVSGLAEATAITALKIYPVPFNEVLKIKLTSNYAGACEFKVMSVLGTEEKRETIPLNRGDNEIELHTGMLKPGVYFLELNSGKESITRKIIK